MAAAALPLRLKPRPKYLSLLLVAVQQAVAYRVPTLLTFLSNLVWVLILLYLWHTVYAQRDQVAGFDWPHMRTYILVSYVVNSLITHYTESGIIWSVRSGHVAVDLTRPVDYMGSQLAQAVGGALVEAAMGAGFALVLGVLVLHVTPPASLAAGVAFALSVILAFVVRFEISFIVSLFSFWTVNGLGLMWARQAVSNVLSGALAPLALFPGWLRAVALVLPFQAMVSTPVLLYLGDVRGASILGALGTQAAWAFALWIGCRLLWRPCVRRLSIQGG